VHDLAKVEPGRKVRKVSAWNCGKSNTSSTLLFLSTCAFFSFLSIHSKKQITGKRTKENYKKQDYVFSTTRYREEETTSRQNLSRHNIVSPLYICFIGYTLFFFYSCTEEYHNYALNLNQGSVRLVLDLGRLLIFHVLSYFLQYKIYIWLEATGHEINGAPENSTEPRSPTLHTPRNNIHSISKSSKQPISKISTPVPESNHHGNI